MKILVSTIACNPVTGSEAALGWFALKSLSKLGDIWLLVSSEHEPYIEEARLKGQVPDNAHFVFIDNNWEPYSENRLLARLQSWRRYMHFSRAILPIARDLHAKIGFDLVHHITYSTWRVGNPLWRLGIPFIWGPISGTEVFPLRKFSGILSPAAKAFELARIASGLVSRFSPEVKRCARKAFHIFAAHGEAVPHLSRLRGTADGVSILSYYSLSQETIAAFTPPLFPVRTGRPLKILAGGNLEGRKGVAIALQGLALAKKEGASFIYRVTSSGPEQKHLEALVKRLGIEDDVSIGHRFDQVEYIKELQDTDLFLLPSLREGGGTTMMEAMLAGCIPIVADCGGPGTAVTDECGVRIPILSPKQMVREIANAVLRFDRDREQVAKMGAAASRRMADHYNDQCYIEEVRKVYVRALEKGTSGH
jgi:glycosyltransferase involved in cell wall biosynthesis